MNILNPRVTLSIQLTLVQQKMLFFKQSIERKFPLTSRARVRGLCLLLLLLAVPRLADARAGTVITDFGGDDLAFALVLQPDGKLVVAGQARPTNPASVGSGDFLVARYLPDGRLDPSFGVGGKVTTDFGGELADAHDLLVQPDGKLVAAGYACPVFPTPCDFALARYLPDGRLDPTFGVGGRVTTSFGSDSRAGALILQSDGNLVAAGLSEDPANPASGFTDFALVRYLPDGRLDTSFGVQGKVTTDFGGGEQGGALVLQPDGKLVAAGLSTDLASGFGDFVLARYLPDGRLDPTFGDQGKVTTDVGNRFDFASALVLQPDGKLVAAGESGDIDFSDFALARYLPDGRLDPTFGVGGTVTTDFGGSFARARASALVLQPDGKLVAAGDSGVAGFGLARYLPDGRLDPTFGVGGKVTTDVRNRFDVAFALVLQPDGKLVAAGDSGASVTIDFALARYLPDGHLDATFGTGFEIIVNELVNFVVQSTSLNPNPVPGGPAGVFTITARFTNKSTENILEPINAIVKTLTNGNKLLSATEGNGGVGSKQAIDAGADDTLIPKESAIVQFRIGLANRNRFSFFVDVSGIVGGDD